MELVLRGRFEKSHEKRYAHVPFDVPAGVRALHVRYQYSDRIASDPTLSGGNTLDIGLFDPRGIAPSSPGFRGWSGSEKLEFSISETWATPPYLAGPIQAGQWHVLLGPYKVGPRGCEYEVRIEFGAEPGVGTQRPTTVVARRPSMAAADAGWLRGDLHCHTLHSDGDSWPADMLARAVERGLDFLGVTDHNQVGHHADYASVRSDWLPVVLPGVEVTTYGGHWNVWGTNRWWEFREPESAAVSRAMQAAAATGALVSINHPKPFGPPWQYPDAIGFHAIEVWNGGWERLNYLSVGWWDAQLRAGRRIVALGGSDLHRLRETDPDVRHARDLGVPTTWACVGEAATPEGVLNALREGRVFLSCEPCGPQLYVKLEADQLVARVVDARNAVLMLVCDDGVATAARVESDDWTMKYQPGNHARYVRAQVMDQRGQMLALSNAQYI